MYLKHLSLVNFRNYLRLELDLGPGVTVLLGGNSQGKTNLLEAIYFLATTKSFRTNNDQELMHWSSAASELPFFRVAAKVERRGSPIDLEISVKVVSMGGGEEGGLIKHIKVNSVPRRAIDYLGEFKVVTFEPQDLEIIGGAPQSRRRYMDILICQLDARYARTLLHYQRVLLQRNHLLRQIREGHARPQELDFWDEQLVEDGVFISQQRKKTVAELGEYTREIYRALTDSGEYLRIVYRASIARTIDHETADIDAEYFREKLALWREREIRQGVSLVGPHRDDLLFLSDGVDMNVYASRGQQRTIALALKLGEGAIFQSRDKEAPVLLLDDAMSELEESRRRCLMDRLQQGQQVVITASDLGPFTPSFLASGDLLTVSQGLITTAERQLET